MKDNRRVHRSVFTFTSRLRAEVLPARITAICQGLPTCLLGKTEEWYSQQITRETQAPLVSSQDLGEWCQLLEERFRDPPNKRVNQGDGMPIQQVDEGEAVPAQTSYKTSRRRRSSAYSKSYSAKNWTTTRTNLQGKSAPIRGPIRTAIRMNQHSN